MARCSARHWEYSSKQGDSDIPPAVMKFKSCGGLGVSHSKRGNCGDGAATMGESDRAKSEGVSYQ